MSRTSKKWTFLSGISYAGQHFLIECRAIQKESSGEYYIETRSREVTLEELKEAKENSTKYYTEL